MTLPIIPVFVVSFLIVVVVVVVASVLIIAVPNTVIVIIVIIIVVVVRSFPNIYDTAIITVTVSIFVLVPIPHLGWISSVSDIAVGMVIIDILIIGIVNFFVAGGGSPRPLPVLVSRNEDVIHFHLIDRLGGENYSGGRSHTAVIVIVFVVSVSISVVAVVVISATSADDAAAAKNGGSRDVDRWGVRVNGVGWGKGHLRLRQ